MSALFAMMKMFCARQDARDFWRESYATCMDKLMRAEAAQNKLKKCVRKQKKAASKARRESDQAYEALGALYAQMEQVDQQRVAAQEARANDQAVLVGLREQLETARAEVSTARCQRDAAENHVANIRIERDRHRDMSHAQDRAERSLRQQLAQAQLQVMNLQHEVHYLNNQLNPILDGEEDGPNMEEDDDEDDEEEEVEPEEGDDPISDLDSDHD